MQRIKTGLPTIIASLVTLAMLLGLVAAASAHPAQPAAPDWPAQSDPGVVLETHRVDVEITDQIARTRITQVFLNEGHRPAEGTYLFPLPEGVTISDLVMVIDGVPIQARILEKDEARRIYDEIVRQLRDPALLEYVGTNAIQANVFPIPPGEKRTLEIEYSQLLPVEDGLVNYVYPLRTDHLSPFPTRDLSIRVSVESNDPISNIYSPTHRVAVSRRGENAFVASFETVNTKEATDFSLYYGIASDEINLNLLSYRDSADEDGFFMALIAPPVNVDESRIIPKDVIIVLDNSGSMFGAKWDQARAAATFVLDNLNAEDRFNVITFSTDARIYARELQRPSEARDAKNWLETVEAIGGTNIDDALQRALEINEGDRQTVILFLTDGLPTEGVTDPGEILKNFEDKAAPNVSLFAFGVGDDVDTFLLDQLSGDYRGASVYVRPNESIDEKVSSLYNKIRAPLMTDLVLDIDGVDVYQTYPDINNLPDLFIGSQLVVAGRYSGSAANATLRLSGKVENETMTFTYDGLSFRQNAGGEGLIPRLWATRRIGELLTAIRLHGEDPELVDSIVRLSIRYGIITPYTSFLITEDDIFTETGRERVFEAAEDELFALDDDASGASAVDAASTSRDMAEGEVAAPPSAPTGQSAATNGGVPGDGAAADSPSPIQIAGNRTFLLRNGVWIDTTYDADTMETQEIVFLSDEYFDLLDSDPRVASFFALGEHVIFVLDGQAYEVVPE